MAFNSARTYPQTGIGQAMQLFVRDGIRIENRAVNGRSTKSFMDEGRLDGIESEIGEGDFLFIEFGHNDEKINDPARYTDPEGQFRDNLRRFIGVARMHDAIPVLITPLERRKYDCESVEINDDAVFMAGSDTAKNEVVRTGILKADATEKRMPEDNTAGSNMPKDDTACSGMPEDDTAGSGMSEDDAAQPHIIPTHGAYPDAVRAVAREEQVLLIDLNSSSRELLDRIGPEASKELFLHVPAGRYTVFPQGHSDNSHLQHAGAVCFAGMIADALTAAGGQYAELVISRQD